MLTMNVTVSPFSSTFAALLFYFISWNFTCVSSTVPCSVDKDCTVTLLEGSQCVDGVCTNPFHNGGCLYRMRKGWTKLRTCNSDDPASAVEMGLCKSPQPLNYREVRIASENWESAFFVAWVMQILLSEVLDVPTTVESGSPLIRMNLYDQQSSFGYGQTGDWGALKRGYELRDCRRLQYADGSNHEVYHSCAHVIPQYWSENLVEGHDYLRLEDLGCVGGNSWYVPKFTAKRHPWVVSFLGLGGEENRRKLAETFLRPTTWKAYCDEVSATNCQVDDGIAVRAPENSEESSSYFVDGLFVGHFRATEMNDCNLNPGTCTGHIADYMCEWWTSVVQPAHHLGIALESSGATDPLGGYTYVQLNQLWKAANATKSDLLMIWNKPDIMYQTFLGTDAEFTKVVLPRPTQSCRENVLQEDRCNLDLETRRGNAAGACDYPEQILRKVISTVLIDSLYSSVSEGLWSPAYDTLMNFKLSDLEIGQMFDYWAGDETEKWTFGPRRAVCRWAAENLDRLLSFIPQSHPRTIQIDDISTKPISVAATLIACVALVSLSASMVGVRVRRKSQAILYAQVTCLYIILIGLLVMSAGSLLLALRPTPTRCVTAIWLTNLGFCLAFVPLMIRVKAISKVIQSGSKTKRVRVSESELSRSLIILLGVVGIFLGAWSILDPPSVSVRYELTETRTASQEVVVMAMEYCASESKLWSALNFVWPGIILLYSIMLASTTMAVQDHMNDTASLTMTLISHAVFFLLRVVLVSLGGSIKPNVNMAVTSMVLGTECIVACLVYIAPKLLTRDDDFDATEADPDLFIQTSIMVADVAGFAAWTSVRAPDQVFKFLEMLYLSLDDLAEKRSIFKLETSGDCYVAATGIPRPQADHAVVLSRFASDCITTMRIVCHKAEILFGPDTGNLSLQIGIHSGPVTGGYLKGKGARFQVFGDTFNKAIHMARFGKEGLIQVSGETAQLLRNAGKQKWLKEREDKVQTQGKLSMQTFWVIRGDSRVSGGTREQGENASSNVSSDIAIPDNGEVDSGDTSWDARLINWNVEVLHNIVKHIAAKPNSTKPTTLGNSSHSSRSSSGEFGDESTVDALTPLDEVKEVICLPTFDRRAAGRQKDVDKIVISPVVLEELKEYVTAIAQMYRDNPFHNFSHASHVVMAVTKFMSRIQDAKEMEVKDERERKFNQHKYAAALHDHTFGITSDPLTHFACVFSALIHDVDHPGVPNPQLIKENEELASTYKNRSVAEQNSFDLSWNLLMDDRFKNLRSAIFASSNDMTRFRQIVVNSVMATDLGDKELKDLRNRRWEKAFSSTDSPGRTENDDLINAHRKATIVLEHLIQAADISHTTQHWEVYRRWNENLFRELYKSFREGRSERNPADFWYEGEIGFFDFYIVPLSKKLRDCGVFGLTSDENLNYAVQNRQLWIEKGQGIVAEMLERAIEEFDRNVETEVAEGHDVSRFDIDA